MRDDFAKVLVERPRHRSYMSFKNERRTKFFKDNEFEFGGRESMKKRYDSYGERKQFNEHLNPLYGWLNSVLGKKWDNSYSELRKKFDTRKVINSHILEHLWQSVETHAFIQDGKVFCELKNTFGTESRIVPINQGLKDFYVCPKDGTLKKSNKMSYKSHRRLKEIEREKEQAKVFRILNDKEHLHLLNGTWFVFEVRDLPFSEVQYVKPTNYSGTEQLFKRGWKVNGKMVPWEELGQDDRERYGTKKIVGTQKDALSGEQIYRRILKARYSNRDQIYQNTQSKAGVGKYYASKKTVAGKVLKDAGISSV